MTPEIRYREAAESYSKGITHVQNKVWDMSLGHFAKAFASHPENVRYVLFLGAALWHCGQKDEAVKLWSLGADQDAMVRIAYLHPAADQLTKDMSRLADAEIRRTLTDLQTATVSHLEDAGRIASAIWPQTHNGPVNYVPGGVKPYMFFVPDFPDVPVFDRKDVPWTQSLEQAADDIRSEFLEVVNSGIKGAPYVHAGGGMGPEWDKLKGRDDWTSLHVFQHGSPTVHTKQCPRTVKTLEALPLVFHNGNPMEVFFSVLKPGTHIPPHYGLSNTRLTVHLPLIIPNNCAIRVGDLEHAWVEGETFLFDDSFDHEAWNKSDDTRVVLIFEAWRPDMTDGEIGAVEKSYASREAWLTSRKVPDVKALISDAT